MNCVKWLSNLIRAFGFVLAFSTSMNADAALFNRTESWTENALLHDGKSIEVKREVEFVMTTRGEISQLFKSWPTTYWLKFEHPKSGKTIKWQGEPHFEPILLDFVNEVPYLVVYGHPDQSNMNKYGCPDIPFIFLQYDESIKNWTHLQQGQIPKELKDANLAPSFDGTYMPQNGHHPSLSIVEYMIRSAEQHSGGFFQSRIPVNFDSWHYSGKQEFKNERKHNDCRPPPIRPLPSPEFEVARQGIIEAGLKAVAVNTTMGFFVPGPEVVTGADVAKSKGIWTGQSYLSSRCDGIVKTVAPIREYFDNGGWHLIGTQLVLNSGKELPFQQTKLAKFQAPTVPQLVTCGNNTIYVVSRENKENLLIHRFTYSGEIIDALHAQLPDVNKIYSGSEWGEIWEVIPVKDQLSIALAVYAYASTANQGGMISSKQTYAVKLPKKLDSNIAYKDIGNTHVSITKSTSQAILRSFRDCPSCPEMIPIPGKNYALGKYEVTQGEWYEVMGYYSGISRIEDIKSQPDLVNRPVTGEIRRISEYLTRLNKKTGKNYRLPTEVEWEYACYGGNQTKYCGGDDFNAVAWFKDNSAQLRYPGGQVGKKQMNGYGFYDMSGNVWELIDGCWKGNCSVKLIRGGSFADYPMDVHEAYRYGESLPNLVGFRLAITLQ